ncbi:MAG: OmpA family protein [Rhodospirillales bacterium]
MARLQETFAATAAPLLPPPTGLGADPERPLVTVVVSSEGVERYGDRPVFLPELSPEPTRFDRFPSPGGIESTLAEPAVAARSMAEPLAGERMAALPAGGGSVKVATILFDDGSARLGRGEMDILRKVAVLHRQLGGSVRVVGHASSRTRNMDADRHRTVNHQISVERASAVARELTRLGVPSERVFATAMADELPVYHEVMPSGEAGNRRAEIFIDY